MGCVSSKKVRSPSHGIDRISSSQAARRGHGVGCLHFSGALRGESDIRVVENIEEPRREREVVVVADEEDESSKKSPDPEDHTVNLKEIQRVASERRTTFSINFGRMVQGEQEAAGWPAWLSAVVGEAIDGWVPFKSDSYERLEKIGQGTYSSVYRARELKTGKTVAVKKVRFDNFQPESVSFMAREILILRKLDHPNIIKLEGIITSRLSCSIYLVFEYMEHDLAGLLSCPDIKFTESQIKCYMKQLLSGLEHCHSRGVMHRDIKTSNILLNNEGILKIADFGLANYTRPKNKQPLTSRVVTMWYRPPELLLGSTNYGESVDLWSVGCVFAELFIGRPILKGRNEVEQLHKIFKLCGSPADDYWRRSRFPLATMFKPQQTYENTLRERCKELPTSVVNLIETFLFIEPYKRGTAASALISQYFNTQPYACDPSSLPKFPPNKEMDAKIREEMRKKSKKSTVARFEAAGRNPRRALKFLAESTEFFNVAHAEEVEAKVQLSRRSHVPGPGPGPGPGGNLHRRRKSSIESRKSFKKSFDTKSEASQTSQMTHESQSTSIDSLPLQVAVSTGFVWAQKQKQLDVFTRLHNHPTASTSQKSSAVDTSTILNARQDTTEEQVNDNSYDIYGQSLASEIYGNKRKGRGRLSGSITFSSQETQTRQVPHRSRFYRGSDVDDPGSRQFESCPLSLICEHQGIRHPLWTAGPSYILVHLDIQIDP